MTDAESKASTNSGTNQTAPEPRWELYRLLSDPTRLRLLALASIEELAVSELAELLRLTQPKVSRHATALREAGLLHGRKQGTWVLLRLASEMAEDAVIGDALATGKKLCERDGIIDRIADILNDRDAQTREFFARGGRPLRSGPPPELAAYLQTMSLLIEDGTLAVDVGTGDGALLEVLAPLYKNVIAIDRSEAQLELAEQRAKRRGFNNVSFVCGSIDSAEVTKKIAEAGKKLKSAPGADAVFAARILHHASVPAKALQSIAKLATKPTKKRRGGLVVVLDYDAHDDQRLREQQADLWLGLSQDDLMEMAGVAKLDSIRYGRTPALWRGDGPDSHLPWHWIAGRRAG